MTNWELQHSLTALNVSLHRIIIRLMISWRCNLESIDTLLALTGTVELTVLHCMSWFTWVLVESLGEYRYFKSYGENQINLGQFIFMHDHFEPLHWKCNWTFYVGIIQIRSDRQKFSRIYTFREFDPSCISQNLFLWMNDDCIYKSRLCIVPVIIIRPHS